MANYWLAVSARGAGDIDGAWNFAVAAWVRSTLSPETAPNLRDDLDRLVAQALIPERSRTLVTREAAGRSDGAANRVGAAQSAVEVSDGRENRSGLRVPPVLPDSDVDRERHAERGRALHALANERRHGLGVLSRAFEQQLVVHGQDHARPSPLCGSAACRSIIAFLRMSAAVPWIGMLTASRSAWLRI